AGRSGCADVRALLAVVAVMVLLPTASAGASPFPAAPLPSGPVPGQVIVKFRAGAGAAARAGALRRGEARPLRSLLLPRTRLVSVPADADVARAAAELSRDPAVAWAQPNSYVAGAAAPDDALFGL